MHFKICKQESLESSQESWNQAKIPRRFGITSTKIYSVGPLGQNFLWIQASLHATDLFFSAEYCTPSLSVGTQHLLVIVHNN